MIKDIVLWPDPILTTEAEWVRVFDTYVRTLAEDLLQTCRANNGLGLAAPQIGVSMQVLVALDRVFVNPVYSSSGPKVEMQEGCLSFPGVVEYVPRYRNIECVYQNLDGKMVKESLSGVLAHVVQHETDHLLGMTIPLRLDLIRRDRFLRRYKQAKRRVNSDDLP